MTYSSFRVASDPASFATTLRDGMRGTVFFTCHEAVPSSGVGAKAFVVANAATPSKSRPAARKISRAFASVIHPSTGTRLDAPAPGMSRFSAPQLPLTTYHG